MTIYKPIQPLANAAVDSAMKLARGEKVDTTETIDNGFQEVPAVLLEPVSLTEVIWSALLSRMVTRRWKKYVKVFGRSMSKAIM